jgi:hypothetical protein
MTRFTEADLDADSGKARPRGSLPYLPRDADAEALQAWLTLAFRPPDGWTVQRFERAGRDKTDAATLVVANGRESKMFRFKAQRDLVRTPRQIVAAVASGWLAMPHLTGSEIEDVWMALCTLGDVLTEYDEADDTRKWIEQMLRVTLPLNGHTLVPDGRHAGLMAMKSLGEFTRSDAEALRRPGEDRGYMQRPVRFIDSTTGDQWLRAGETATFVRWVIGVEPLSGATLKARLHEIGVVGRPFEDYRPPHPKLNLYQLTDRLIGGLGGEK